MKRFRLVAVGGTFDIIHKGHKRLLDLAFSIGRYVIIGVSSDEFALQHGKIVESYDKRINTLKDLLDKHYMNRYTIIKLEDDFGPTLFDNDIEALIVSKETEEKGNLLNKLRREKGLRPLEIIVMDMIQANDGKPISSSRIRRGEIDANGNVLQKTMNDYDKYLNIPNDNYENMYLSIRSFDFSLLFLKSLIKIIDLSIRSSLHS